MSNTMTNISGFWQGIYSRKEFIKKVTEAKQYEKLICELEDANFLAQRQRELNANLAKGFFPVLDDPSFEHVQHELYGCAMQLCNNTYLSVLGVVPLVCSSISGAICGKVDIEIYEGWHEAGVDQIVGFAESGRRKTACIDRLDSVVI